MPSVSGVVFRSFVDLKIILCEVRFDTRSQEVIEVFDSNGVCYPTIIIHSIPGSSRLSAQTAKDYRISEDQIPISCVLHTTVCGLPKALQSHLPVFEHCPLVIIFQPNCYVQHVLGHHLKSPDRGKRMVHHYIPHMPKSDKRVW